MIDIANVHSFQLFKSYFKTVCQAIYHFTFVPLSFGNITDLSPTHLGASIPPINRSFFYFFLDWESHHYVLKTRFANSVQHFIERACVKF